MSLGCLCVASGEKLSLALAKLMTKPIELIVAWVIVFAYIIIGGIALRNIELAEEIKQATDYCVKVADN